MSTDPQKATLNPVDSLILASGSPRRKELLGSLLKNFKIITSEVEELQSHQDGPVQLVMENSGLKPWQWPSLIHRNGYWGLIP